MNTLARQPGTISLPEDHALEVTAHAPAVPRHEAMRHTIQQARTAQGPWAALSVKARLQVLRRWRYLLAKNVSELADCVQTAWRRDRHETLTTEVLPLLESCRWLERHAVHTLKCQRVSGRGRPLWLSGVDLEIHHEPMGVVLIIAPFNYPLMLPAAQMMQALAAGNAVLIKPAVGCSLPVVYMQRWAEQAGVPQRLIQVLEESPQAASLAMQSGVDKVFFTGSASTGRVILQQLAEPLTPSVMELSGCDAVLVLADADVKWVARHLAFGLTVNRSATCIAPRRVFVPRGLGDALGQELVALLRGAEASPISAASAETLQQLIREAVVQGAQMVLGDAKAQAGECRPVVLRDATMKMRLLNVDVFAPVISLVEYERIEEGIAALNQCPYKLAASIFGDEQSAHALAAELDVGTVVINDLIVPTADPRLPLAARGQSGFGVTRGREGLLEMTKLKAVSIHHGRWRPHLDAPREGDDRMFESYIQASHTGTWLERVRGVCSVIGWLRSRSQRPEKSPASRTSIQNIHERNRSQ